MGAYIFIALVEYLTSEEAGQPLRNRFAWPVGGILGLTGTNTQAKSNGVASNGFVKMNGNGKASNGVVKVNGKANGVANGKATGKAL